MVELWDSPDVWGREHRRLAKSALSRAEAAFKRRDVESFMVWTTAYCKHSREAVKLMLFKRLILLDVDGLLPQSTLSEKAKKELESA